MKNRLGIAVIVVAAAIAGCGNSRSTSSSKSSASSLALTPTAYRAKVNGICSRGNAQISALPTGTETTIAGLERMVKIGQGVVAQLKSVTPPQSLKTGVQSWLGTLDQERALASEAVQDLKAGKVDQARALAAKGEALDAKVNAQARALGSLPACAKTPTPSGK